MILETQLQNSPQDGSKNRPKHVLDFVTSNPFVRPWMKGFVPRNVLLRDLLVFAFGNIAGLLVIFSATFLSEGPGQVIVVIVGLIISLIFQSDVVSRHVYAYVRYHQEKRKSRTSDG